MSNVFDAKAKLAKEPFTADDPSAFRQGRGILANGVIETAGHTTNRGLGDHVGRSRLAIGRMKANLFTFAQIALVTSGL